ncbi:MAG: nucleoside recognition domain-containing protein [Termitinemataceae bacterium]
MNKKPLIQHLSSALSKSWKPALQTIRFLLSVMIPVSLGVLVLEKTGLLAMAAQILDPAMHILGLPGESSLVLVSAMLLNIYSAIAVIGTLHMTLREITIVAVMCLIAHNLIIESAVMRKTGSSITKMVFLRIFAAILAGFLLNYILPKTFGASKAEMLQTAPVAPAVAVPVDTAMSDTALSSTAPSETFVGSTVPESSNPPGSHMLYSDMFLLVQNWLMQMGKLMLKIASIVSALMFLQKLLEEFGILELIGKLLGPFMRCIGLPTSTGFLWIVANVVGLAYGSAIMIERVDTGKLSLSEGDLFNHHVGISHSLLEDTLLFMAIGVPLFWALVPRFLLAVSIVWVERVRIVLFRRSFKVGTL